MSSEGIRNFAIIAHVDHGKSTLADRFLELTGAVAQRRMRAQFLDQMELERERGITIKMQPVRMVYRPTALSDRPRGGLDGTDEHEDLDRSGRVPISSSEAIHQAGRSYILNLIDTPGHADFSYEVSRALAAVEGAILLVDATQGVQAQTVAHLNVARAQGLSIVPAINKVDIGRARVPSVAEEIMALTGCSRGDISEVSAKTGQGVPSLLTALIRRVPPPPRSPRAVRSSGAARALIFDSHFDPYRGVVAHVRVFGGEFRNGEAALLLGAGRRFEINELGYFAPELRPAAALGAGEIGYVATGLREPEVVRVGDTVALAADAARARPLPGYRPPQPAVFASVFPAEAAGYAKLRDALAKVRLNDAAITAEPVSSPLGRGFRAGFLGTLHMEIVRERLKREHGLAPVFTHPSVAYRLRGGDGRMSAIASAVEVPDGIGPGELLEPWVRLEVILPPRAQGGVLALLGQTRGRLVARRPLGAERLALAYELPLADLIADFADSLQAVTAGFGSFSYETIGYAAGELVRLDILVAGAREPALSRVVARERASREGRELVRALAELLARRLFSVPIQAAVGGRIIARETVPALRKNVTANLYGGDRTRKLKLWARQKRGKERLASRGRVAVPPEVFSALLRR